MGAAISPSLTLEDRIGAGAILSQLEGRLSPEAAAAVAAFQIHQHRLPSVLRQCSSGKELVERGFATDVELAAQLNASDAVARLMQGALQNEKDTPPND
ncbi:MAG: 2-phosphosulfolactate phosphatase [Synechococcales cyanobacterium M58_A2018_015]|nr:2-phosphosulfolactate phosphatase [Synechococcales cyanobacterium M58_A2018_015]